MSKSYRIHRLFINNFKLVDETELNFEGKDLVVLDGPNGYGKTTIFDCIELTLTGKIHRIKNNEITKGNRGANRNIFQKKENKETYIILELKDKNDLKDTLILAIYIASTVGRKGKKASNTWDRIKRVKLEKYKTDFQSLQTAKVITNEDINTIFGIKDIESFFNIINYVQQEEALHFLKQKDAERHSLISNLIDIQKEKSENEKFKFLEKRLKGSIKSLKSKQKTNDNELQKYQQLTDKDNIDPSDYVSIFEILGLSDRQDLWDKEIKTKISLENRNTYINDVESVKGFLKNKESFLNNFLLEQKTTNDYRLLLKHFICGWNFEKNHKNLNQKFEDYSFLKKTKNELKKDRVITSFKTLDVIKLQNILSIIIDKDNITVYLDKIEFIQISESNISKALGILLQKRQEFEREFKAILEKNEVNVSDKKCPLCGTDFELRRLLLENFENQNNLLSSLSSENMANKNELFDELYSNHIDTIIDLINRYLENPENNVEKDFLNQIAIPQSYLPAIAEFIKWSEENKIIINDKLNKELNQVLNRKEIEQRINAIIQQIKNLEKRVPNYEKIKSIFLTVFAGDKSTLELISLSILDDKIRYINGQFHKFNNDELTRINTEKETLSNQLKKKNLVLNKVTTIAQTYKETIKSYTKKIVKEIEIPFFIYSGRIIQEYENGNGIFIQTFDDRELKGDNVMIFTSKSDDEHDALHSLSSGQLSALVIAFMLTLNKIYGDNGLNTILIDDPVQTMDDINSASFVDILRNEFSDRQHILSTHELDSSLYLRYKFKKYGLSVQRINVKNEI